MVRPLARAAGFLAYALITFEMLFMVTPFALYYYSIYSPLLSWPTRLRATAWMPAFFLPHLSSEVVPSIGGLIFLVGLLGFVLGAFQLYYAKFRPRGVVQTHLYKSIRHPQYLFLAFAGLGLLIVWPRFIALIGYINVLWFYYLLARDEERRMEARCGESYRQHMRRTSMFLPGEPGARLAQRLFGWVPHRRERLLVIYAVSLVVAIGAAFTLRAMSLRLTTHLTLPDRKIAAVSSIPRDGRQLRELIQSWEADDEIHNLVGRLDEWVLVQAVEGKGHVIHVMIDAGMTRASAQDLPLTKEGVKLVYSRRRDSSENDGPFSTRARWQPIAVAELDDQKVSRVIELDHALFLGNPVMPIF